MTPRDTRFEDIVIGQTAQFERTVTDADIRAFADLTGDQNPLHTDDTYAAATRFGRRVAHGMLLGSLFSTLVGMHLPGLRCLYLSQSLNFRRPVFPGDRVIVRGTVRHVSSAARTVTIATQVLDASEAVCVDGEAVVQVL